MKRLTWLTWPVLCVSVLLGPAMGPAMGAGEPPPGGPSQTSEQTRNDGAIDRDAMNALKRMADTLAQAKGFSVTIRGSYDVVQDTGEKIEFGERRTVMLNRPDALRVEAQESDGKQTLVMFDGKAITVFNPGENVYGQIEKAGTVDDAVRYLVQDLQVRLPLALMLVSTLPAELEQRLQALDYVERDTLTAVPADHLAGRSKDVDFQIWIAAGDAPLPQRIAITYKADKGQPQYRADFTDWNLNPDASAVQFAFRPPDGAERIPVMMRVRRSAAGQQPATDDTARGTPGPSGKTEGTPK